MPLAEQINDRRELALIHYNLSVLYLEVLDFESAEGHAEECRRILAFLPATDFMPDLLVQLGRLHGLLGDSAHALSWFRQGIEAAENREADIYDPSASVRAVAKGSLALEASGWGLLGGELLAERNLPEAESAALNALRLRTLFDPPKLPLSYAQLGALELARDHLDAAARLTQLAIDSPGVAPPLYLLKHQQGRIEMARGHWEQAMKDYESSFGLAMQWRAGLLPAISSLDGANVELDREVAREFIEAGARYSLAHASEPAGERWKRESFLTLELNRASALRDDLALGEVWRKRLPPEYWSMLVRLRSEESRALTAGGVSTQANRLHLELTEMEARAAHGVDVNYTEIFRNQTSLNHFQNGLRESEVILSFHLGKDSSYLWAVTRSSVALYELPPAAKISSMVRDFRESLLESREDAAARGGEIYRELFGKLGRLENEKADWLLSLDDALFELPFAALATERKDGRPVYLIEKHSLQVVPGALLLSAAPRTPQRGPNP